MKSTLVHLTFVILALPLLACEPAETPETECDAYIAARKQAGWPAGDAVKSACVAELSKIKDTDAELWTHLTGCFGESVDVEATHTCGETWMKGEAGFVGFGSEGSGAWAEGSPKALDAEACKEGAFVIAHRKQAFGLFSTPSERDIHRKELEEGCNQQKADGAFVAMFGCLRRAKQQGELATCVGGTATPYGDPAVIEACVSECTAQHGNEPTPAYLSCFEACKASKTAP